MAQPYVGEIRMFAGNFAPAGWMMCDGQLLAISENETLFQLIGTTYGGDGQSTFALPNLQSRIPIHAGSGPGGITRQLAEAGGTESVTLTTQQIPVHNHAFLASTATGTQNSPAGEVLASGSSVLIYRPQAPSQPLAAQTISPTGGSQPHDNMVPYLCINFIISLFGIFPSPT
ncbi:MAG: phage tail protein [Sphingosinicella sp.]|uniref:phage tail protein n=1 Tax=Sphingosinicella sp. TaxID=1917971 RepID=UPI004037E445